MTRAFPARGALALVVAVIGAACSAGSGAGSTPTQDVTSEPAATSSPRATTAAPGQTTTSLVFRDVNQSVLQPRQGFWDSLFVDPGAVIYHGGLFYMFYNGIAAYPSQAGVGFATSTDGVTWVRETDEPLFTGESLDYLQVSLFVSSGMVSDDGTWVLYFYTQGRDDVTRSGVIGMATAPEPRGPWTLSEHPVLDVGPEGSWDSFAVLNPSVVETADGYLMYYDGSRGDLNSERDRMIGLATSEDGATWTKHDDPATTKPPYARSDPLLVAGRAGDWDELRAYDPNIVRVGDRFEMSYMSYKPDGSRPVVNYQLGVATSEDGVRWAKDETDSPILESGETGWQGIFLSSLIEVNGALYLYFDVQRGIQGTTEVWLLSETDP